ALTEGRIKMSNKEKFEGFKQKMVDDNEKKYGKEVREKYGNDTVEKSNAKLMNMTEAQYDEVTALANQVTETLAEAFATGDPAGELAQKAADLHKKWLTYYWSEYSKEAHAGLAQMYVDDPRFTAYYDEKQPGTAEFLRDAVLIYTGMNK
ncbi:MAG: transcriptional regulator, MerR family protein, partial [Clostridia bacterium]|nr:transcriptional regulator, MerR family protein [Clostridia bacterium]